MSKVRDEALKVLQDNINCLVWPRGMSTSTIRRQLFNIPALHAENTSVPAVRQELVGLEAEGLVTADRRMQNVTVWSLV